MPIPGCNLPFPNPHQSSLKRSTLPLFLSCLCILAVSWPQTSAAHDRPNIIFFLVDDYDKQETSPYGEFVPGGNTRGAEEAGPLLKRLKEFYDSGPKSKKRQNKINRR